MTRMQIGADVIAALGVSLGEVAHALEATRDGSVDRWALGGGEAADAFDSLLSGWRRNRLALAEALRDLGDGLERIAAQARGRTEGAGPTMARAWDQVHLEELAAAPPSLSAPTSSRRVPFTWSSRPTP